MRDGHLHVEETGEELSPESAAFHLPPEESNPRCPAVFPPSAFLKTAYRGQYEAGANVLNTVTTSWTAILVREGCLAATVDATAVVVNEPELLIVDQSCCLAVRAEASCELAFAVGWPREDEGQSK